LTERSFSFYYNITIIDNTKVVMNKKKQWSSPLIIRQSYRRFINCLSNVVFLVAITSLTSCVSTNRGFQSSPVISRNVQLDPIKADIQVDETKKLKGESSSGYFYSSKSSAKS
jgi:hypothetical protein